MEGHSKCRYLTRVSNHILVTNLPNFQYVIIGLLKNKKFNFPHLSGELRFKMVVMCGFYIT